MNDLNDQLNKIDLNKNNLEENVLVRSLSLTSESSSSSSSSTSGSSSLYGSESDVDLIAQLISIIDMDFETANYIEFNSNEINNNLTKENVSRILRNYLLVQKQNETELSIQNEVEMSFDKSDDDEFIETGHIRLNESKSVLISTDQDEQVSYESYIEFECKQEEATCLTQIKENGNFKQKQNLKIEFENLPKNLIATNLPDELFSSKENKSKFEKIFLELDSNCKFFYFKAFKRCSIYFQNSIATILARVEYNNYLFLNKKLKLFLNKPIKLKNSRMLLEAPQNNKSFLISPPSSPPIGWEQIKEDPPVVNLDLLAALSKLNPLEPYEIIESKDDIPGIVVHPCPDLFDKFDNNRKFIPTRRPANDFY